MIVVFMVLFLLGFYLFGLAFTAAAWQGLIFIAGLLSVSLALALIVHGPDRAKSETRH